MAGNLHWDDDKEVYISKKFHMYESYWRDVMEAEATDNWQMYNGWDSYIRQRKSEHRSHLQLPILYPAIEGRVAQTMAKLTSKEPIVQFQAVDKKNAFDVLSALKVQQWIRNVLDRQNWLEEIATMMIAAEVFPLVWVKCRIGELEMTPAEQKLLGDSMGIPSRLLAGQTRMVPEFEVLSPGNVYHDFRATNSNGFIQKFHIKHIDVGEIHTMFGSDVVKKVELHQSREPQWLKDWEEAAGRRAYRDQGEDRFRLAEGWILAHHSDGTVEKRVVRFFPDVIRSEFGSTPVGLLIDDEEPPESFDPFTPVVSRRLPFQLMGKSTVSLGKAFQREASELTNMAIDILGYTAAPPILMQKGTVDNPDQLEFSARSLWLLNDDVSMLPQPLHVPTPNAPFLQGMMQNVSEQMNHITAAYEGVTGQPSVGGEQTLGEFRGRTQSGMGRLDLPLMGYTKVITNIVTKYWYYMREYPRSILARTPLPVQTPIGKQNVTTDDLDVDVTIMIKNLSGFENNEIKKIELDRAIERSLAYPIVQFNPALMQVLLKMYWKAHIDNPADYEEFLTALAGPLDPGLQGTGGTNGATPGVNNRGMPMTQFSPGVGNIERNAGLVSAATAGGG